jgi:hypothetical protein
MLSAASESRSRWSGWVMAFLVGLVLLLGGLVLGLWVAVSRAAIPVGRPAWADTATVVREVQGLNQLVTVKYVLEKVVLLEDVKWYGGSRLLLIAHGVTKAGVDLSRLEKSDLEVTGTRVRVRLPRAQMFDVYLDDRRTQVVERSTGLLREFDKDLEQEARRHAVDQIRIAARDAGILKEAEERARTQVVEWFRRAGFSEVEVGFR